MTTKITSDIWIGIKNWWLDILGKRVYFRYLEKEDRKRRLSSQFFTLATIGLGIYYIIWHLRWINWEFWYFSPLFFLAELIGLLLFTFFALNAWFLRFHSPEGIPFETPLSVDVFITVAGEPVELVKETVEASVKIDYPYKKVYILDDKGEASYERLAQTFGCGYFARKEHRDAKAGNLNYAFERTSGDLILTLDADQVPKPEIIKTLIGYFKIPRIAFVQTKQDFKVPIGDPFGNTDKIFYNVMQSGKDTDNAAFSCGSGVIYRRKALEEIGGFSTWNIVEDVHTSMLLHDKGWRSIYYNYPLSKGTAPADIYGVYRQRRQWAADSLRILFWDNPFKRKGLSFKQKLQYFHLGFVYIVAAFIMPIFFITPIICLLTNNFVLKSPVNEYVIHRFPYFISMSIAYGILNFPTPYMKAFQMWTGLFPTFIWATWIALRSKNKKPPYKVNPKPVGEVKPKNPWLAILPQISIIFFSLLSMIYGFIKEVIEWDFYLLNCVWACWSIWTMSGICLAAIKKHKWPKKDEVEEESRLFPLFSKIKELIFIVSISILITIFFLLADMNEVSKSLNRFRREILSFLGYKRAANFIFFHEIIRKPKALEQKDEFVKKERNIKNEWVVQVFSSKSLDEATKYFQEFFSRGFNVYLIKAEIRGEDWYRVRIGFFQSEKDAKDTMSKILSQISTKSPLWVTKASFEEFNLYGRPER